MYAVLKTLANKMSEAGVEDSPLFHNLMCENSTKQVGLATIGSWIIEALETAPVLSEARRPAVGYEWREDDCGWDENRPLTDKAPFFSRNLYIVESECDLKNNLMDAIQLILQNSIPEMELIVMQQVQRNLRTTFYGMSYESLKDLAYELSYDSYRQQESKIYIQLLGSAGTSASAMVVIDITKEAHCNDTDLADVLTAIPFNIAYSTKQLVEEFVKLLKNIKANPDW